jgi:RNA polymerase sigma factor (TIGR02999 family)
MRRILVENARRKRRLRRGGDRQKVDLDDVEIVTDEVVDDFLALDDALNKLAQEDPVKAELVKLRYFAGLSADQAADVLQISRVTVSRYWAYVRAWLFREIHGED